MVQTHDFSGDEMEAIFYIGTTAAVVTTSSFVPQVLKIRRQGGEDLSYPMLFLYLSGTLLWLTYGLILHAGAVIWANGITAMLVALSIVLKMNYSPRGRDANRCSEPRTMD
jgi:MtN3 and saliva related transmembrane protein